MGSLLGLRWLWWPMQGRLGLSFSREKAMAQHALTHPSCVKVREGWAYPTSPLDIFWPANYLPPQVRLGGGVGERGRIGLAGWVDGWIERY